MIVEEFLTRLSKVKRTGRGQWLACCPSHGDKNPSMSIRETDDGKVLINCFAGCGVEEIVGAVGMLVSDLFPPGLVSDHEKPIRPPFNARDVLEACALEMTVVVVCASDVAKGKELSSGARNRLLLAAERISTALERVNG